ncbi:PadR family transcriptional regulator [Georgenia sp. TF02-10]|uniref:PadR family transcriptional regulator n=1 Tax=Georgenia sp. TF02-10 TaxID=2917725 RepID=UPI001FA75180|nr:PadR family transcriptional regulator [Georgenia sp. TF02-10]UNX53791.1 PadR family transcriptional regulator [Georgenia sp. TF02-10]
MDGIDWRAEVTRGALSYAVLAALASQGRHGYQLGSLLRSHGFPRIQGGTLYPLLRRLEDHGVISHAWDTSAPGPARKVFSLTALGRAELQNARRAWVETTRALESLQHADDERR